MNLAEIVIYPVSKLLIFHPHLKETAIEYNHIHTYCIRPRENRVCTLCTAIYINKSRAERHKMSV